MSFVPAASSLSQALSRALLASGAGRVQGRWWYLSLRETCEDFSDVEDALLQVPVFLGLPRAQGPGAQTPLLHPAVLAACFDFFLEAHTAVFGISLVTFRSLLLNQLIVFLLQVAYVPVPTALTAAIGSHSPHTQ